jgi:hypothetical protein
MRKLGACFRCKQRKIQVSRWNAISKTQPNHAVV